MSSLDFNATTAPQDIVAELSLTVGTSYTLQNVSTAAVLMVREGASPPAATDRAFKVEPGQSATIRPESGLGVYLWSSAAAGCPVVVGAAV